MTSIFKRANRAGWTVKWREPSGRWRMRSFRTEWQAEQFDRQIRMGMPGGPMPTLLEWSTHWLEGVDAVHSRNTAALYRWAFSRYILPALGAVPLEKLTRAHARDLGLEMLKTGKARSTVKAVLQTLSAVLASAIDDGVLMVNVTTRIRLQLRLGDVHEAAVPKSFTLDEARAFLTATAHDPDLGPLFRLMLYTGLRVGEALGLAWDDIDWRAGRLVVVRAWNRGRLSQTKTRRERLVDVPKVMLEELRALNAAAKSGALARGVPCPAQLFSVRRLQAVQAAFRRVTAKAGLPGHFTPHSLRHTYARQQLEAGASVKYVQQQLGHRSIGMTADLYGRFADLGSGETADTLASRLSPSLSPPSAKRSARGSARAT